MAYCKYYKEEEYISIDGGTTWTAMGVYRKGDLLEYDSPDCTPAPTGGTKFYATYNDSTTYSAACGDNTTLESGDTKPEGYDYSAMTTAEIGSCVTSIGSQAFRGCTSLSSINIPSGVTSIDSQAFYQCRSLPSIVIPDSVTSIGVTAFQWCSGMTSVTIGSGVISIGVSTFRYCSGITSIDIPDSVTSIGEFAFRYCSGLTSCTIGSGVTSIGRYAFDSCISLTSITVNATTPPTLGSSAFDNTNNCPIYVPCQSLEVYKTAWSTYASRVQCVEPSFDGKFKATYTGGTTYSAACDGSTELRNSDTHPIDYQSTAMTDAWIGDCITNIGQYAFSGCTSLSSCTIGSGVTSIGNGVFARCTGLTSIDIPDSVTTISGSAFDFCSGLTSVTIGSGIRSIGKQAFWDCRSLTSLTVEAVTPPYLGDTGFVNTPIVSGTGYIFVPAGSVDSYKAANYWKMYANQIRPIT